MPGLTTQELIDEVGLNLADRDDEHATPTRVVRSLNFAQKYIARVFSPRELEFNITTDVNSDPLRSSIGMQVLNFSTLGVVPRFIYSFRYLTGDHASQKLVGFSPRQFDKAFPEPGFQGNGKPNAYIEFADRFEFDCPFDGVYDLNIRGAKWPADLSTDSLSSTSDFEGLDEILVAYATGYIFNSLRQEKTSDRWFRIMRSKATEMGLGEDLRVPDRTIAASHEANQPYSGPSPWLDPFVRNV